MVRSLAVVLGVVGVVVVATQALGRDPDLTVDYTGTLQSARIGAPYEVLAPEGLADYTATSVRFTAQGQTTVWHLGFLTPSEAYAAIDQTDGDPGEFVAVLTEGAVADGSAVTIDGEPWERYAGGGDSADENVRGLVRQQTGSTVLVSGTADWAELETFAGALVAE